MSLKIGQYDLVTLGEFCRINMHNCTSSPDGILEVHEHISPYALNWEQNSSKTCDNSKGTSKSVCYMYGLNNITVLINDLLKFLYE